MIDAHEQVERFQDFFEANYKKQIHEIISKGLKSLVVDFAELSEFDHELADLLLDEPEEVIKAAELAVEQFDIKETIRVRFKNLPKSQHLMIKDIRSKHINALLYFEAIVRQSSDIRPQVVCAKFECPACGSVITILQIETKFKEPSRCTCGRKGKFRLLSKDLVDAQRLVVEEAPEDLEGGAQPKRMSVFLKEDLVEPKMEKKTTPGSKVGVVGTVKEIPIILKSGVTSTRYDLMIDANYLEPIQEEFIEIELNPEDEAEIKNLASDPHIYERLVNSIAPSIWGHEKIKEALILQLIGGVRKHKKDGTITRGDMHILLVGDPGSGKSALLQFISKAAPKARYVAGRSTTGAGICVAPNSLVMTNPGGLHEIQGIVEEKLANNEEWYKEIAWKSKVPSSDMNIFTLDKKFNVHSKKIDQFWRILPPEKMCRLKVRSGKEIMVTPNTMLLTISNGEVVWRKSSEIIDGDFVATARKLPSLQKKKVLVIKLIKSNPIVYGVKLKVREMIEKLTKTKTKRDLARELRLNENKLYHHWIKEEARGNIHLDDLKSLAELSRTPLEEIAPFIKALSLYKGHRIKVPVYINKDLMYFVGLIAGDGDLSEGEHTVGVRFSNSDKNLMKSFVSLSKGLFGVNCNLSSDGTKRVESYRFSSKLVFEILESLGIPTSPKSATIDMSNLLLNLDDELITSYLSGYFDTDGSVVKRKNGSSYVDLSSSSKNIAKKLPLLLLRFGIHSKVRKKSININPKVVTKHENYLIEIKGKDNLVLFRDKVGFKNPRKSDRLTKIISALPKSNTNVDVVPNVSLLFKKIVAKYEGSYKDLGLNHKHLKSLCNPSKGRLREIVNKIEKAGLDGQEVDLLRDLANSDIFWDQVVVNDLINHDFEYVYDLTVSDSHNFLVDGFVVHNTASVVKDEFLRGWALEAGAMVLANKGILCLHPETNVIFDDKIIPISKLYNSINEKKILTSKKEEIYFNEIKGMVPSFDFKNRNTTNSETIKITRKFYKGILLKIDFESGSLIKLTPDHKLINNLFKWEEAKNFKKGDYVLANKKTDNNFFKDKIKSITEELYEGYVYDLLVPTHHNFVASGVFVHNCLDEMDKMAREDTDALHEAMEQQQVTITKANIQATLRSETTILAAANPKLGRFDPYKLVAEQIDLPPALINRFDLIFPIRDLPDKDRDGKIAQRVLELQKEPESAEPEIPVKTLRKFISYVKQNVFPKMSEEALDEIKKFYVGLRNTETAGDKEGRRKPIPITPRQLEALIRLAESSARVRLDTKIKRQDARRAIELLKYCLMQVGIDPETGQIDIDVLSSGISTSTKNKMFLVREIISSLEEQSRDKNIPINQVMSAAESKGLDENTVMQIIDRLNREGEIFKPREGFVKRI